MHSDGYASRYHPASPLSPRISSGHSSLSQSSSRSRSGHSKQSSHSFRLDLPTYPGVVPRGYGASPPSAPHSPAITLNRGTQPISMESPRLMREKQKELIAKAQLTSKLAASALTIKPEAPRLDPLGSPKGAVTPLALEEAADYFAVGGVGRYSPAASPSARSSRSSTSSTREEKKKKKKHSLVLYQ